MGKRETKQALRDTQEERRRRTGMEEAFLGEQAAERVGAREKAGRLSEALEKGWGTFAETGGYSPEDIAGIRQRSLSGIPSIYERARQELGRRSAVQGGYMPGFGGNLAQMARQMSQIQAEKARDVELGISGAVRQGKIAGMGGLAQLYGAAPGELSEIDRKKLAMMGIGGQQIAELLGQQSTLARQPGIWGNILKGLGAGAGMAANFIPGMGLAKSALKFAIPPGGGDYAPGA